jgi:uncharacterized protein (TIGR02301 family)
MSATRFIGRSLIAMVLAAGLANANAQSKAPAAKAAAAPSPPPPASVEPPSPPYEPQLMRLAEIMGALAFLRDLCGPKDGETWRAKMAALLEAEAKTEKRKEMLAGAFNRGFRGYEIIYRSCTPAADSVIVRYLDEGARLAHELTNRFGG